MYTVDTPLKFTPGIENDDWPRRAWELRKRSEAKEAAERALIR